MTAFYNLPSKVAYVKAAQHFGFPIGLGLYESVLKEYPEYFKEELAHRRKYDAIPKIEKEYHFKVLEDLWFEQGEELKTIEYGGILESRKDVLEKADTIFKKYKDLEEIENNRFKTQWNL